MALKQVLTAPALEPCWIAGEKKYSSMHSAKVFSRHEINAIDIVASSERIQKIIDSNQDKRESNNALQTRSRSLVTFRDLTRLTFGATYILGQQVDTLLDETKHLLDQIMGNEFQVPVGARPQMAYGCRKRKQIISLCVSKRARIEGPKFLDKQNIQYYRHMLAECHLWNAESNAPQIDEIYQSPTIQMPRTCLSDHKISITHELTLTEMDQDLMLSDGFGESNQTDLIALEEFLQPRNSLKCSSADHSLTGLCYKMPRLDGNELDVYQPNNGAQAVDHRQEIEDVALLPLLPLPIVVQSRKRKRNYRLKERPKRSSEEVELICENTIRTIFGADYDDALGKEILAPRQSQAPVNDVPEMPTTESAELPNSQPSINTGNNNNNNNNAYEHSKSYKNNNIDSHSIMMDLLNILRNNPDKKSIDANSYVKSFPDRITAALTFSHLLCLKRDGFIELSKKPGTLEIDAITLGAESNKLIEDILK
ncbi:GH10313 [Drosophila grimshawi]|uniref:GH10313 n=1 Tax=Drosophila grimshawi TaxID=7222 RepID=B4JAC0_DROGR|nr:GH10313 [Drosophila grimshawi]